MIKKTLLLAFAIFTLNSGFSQNKIERNIEIADAYFEVSAYFYSIQYYSKAYEIQPNTQLAKKNAYLNLLLRKYPEAEYWYRKIETSSFIDDSTLLHFAKVLTCLGKYEEAKQVYNQYIKVMPENDSIGSVNIAWCDTATRWIARPLPYDIENASTLNTKYSEICPILNGDNIYFSSSRVENEYQEIDPMTGEGYYKILISKMTDSNKLPAKRFFKNSGDYHEIISMFNSTSDTLYYAKSAVVKSDEGKLESKLRIYRAAIKNGVCGRSERFVLNDSIYSFAQSAISTDGRMFIFSSDMPGGFGKNDLYVSFRIDTTWTKPINLGETINTSGDEIYPFFHDDGTLYFSSDGMHGMGGFDLFSASLVDGEWTAVTNLKSPINSSADDFCLYLNYNKTRGFFSSNRQGGKGADDIYQFILR